jgi:HK97 family phage portal protein
MRILDTIQDLVRKRPSDRDFASLLQQEQNALTTAITKANEPLAALLRRSGGSEGSGQDWAKGVYGDYYATTVHVYRAVKLRADAVAASRLKVWSTNRGGDKEWVGEDHPVQQFLDRVNPFWSRVDMWRAVETYLSLWGSCFRWINKPTSDPGSWEMWTLRPDKVSIIKDQSAGPTNQYIKGFVYDPGGAKFAMLPDEVIWDRYFNPLDEFAGMSPLAPARLIIDMQASMLDTNRDLFRNGMLTSNLAFLMHGPLSNAQIETFYERLSDRHAGKGNAQKPIVVDMGQGDVKNMGFSNKEMEFLEGIQLTKEFVLSVYGLPEELIPGARHATFSNREEARREFYESTITQEWALLESSMQEKFLPMLPINASNQGLIVEFDRDNIPALEENVDRRSERHLKEVSAGVRTVNEFRESVGLPQVSEGDILLMPSAVIPMPVLEGSGSRSASSLVSPPQSRRQLASASMDSDLDMGVTLLDRTTWESFEKRFDRSRREFHELMDELFEDQRADTLRSLGRIIGAKSKAKDQMEAVNRAGPSDIFRSGDWRQKFLDSGIPMISNILRRSARAQVIEFGLGIDFNIANAATQTWIDTRTKFWADRVNTETGKQITNQIRTGLSEGEGIRKLQGRVNQVFNFAKSTRSELIARTESVSASNQGHVEAYRQADVPRKRWLATLDDRTRDSHSDAHGQEVDREQSFLVGGAEMFMPGQGPVQEVANCRCTSLPVFDQ